MEYLLVNNFYNMDFDSEFFVQQSGSIVEQKIKTKRVNLLVLLFFSSRYIVAAETPVAS